MKALRIYFSLNKVNPSYINVEKVVKAPKKPSVNNKYIYLFIGLNVI
jgi:hypothetical protein